VELDEDKVEVVAAAPGAARDKGQVGWAAQPPGLEVIVSARHVDIVNRTSSGNPVPKNSVRNVARG